MSVYDFTVKARKGEDFSLSQLKGKVLLIVNTATGCGFTPQYKGLEELYEAYHDRGLEVLDFPCNQFGHQAPGEDEEIHAFCTGRYKTQFDQFRKLDVNGETADPLFVWLKQNAPEEEEPKGLKNKAAMKMIAGISSTCKEKNDIKWNFTKFLLDREGNIVKRYGPTSAPEDFRADVEALL